MKKAAFTVLWTFAFFAGGFITFVAHIPPNAQVNWSEIQHTGIADWLLAIPYPIAALILGICGKLPGTRRKKGLPQK